MNDFRYLIAVWALLDDEDDEVWVSFSETSSNDATC